jgi:hypothetical protein
MICEHLLHTTLLLRLLLQRIEVLQQQVTHRTCWFELEWQHAMGGEDSQEHLHPLLDLFHPTETLVHPALDSALRRFVPSLQGKIE